MWKLPNGKVTRVPKGIEVEGVKYPASIFRRWSKEELAEIGIKPYREVKYDSKWYKSTGSVEEEIDGDIVKTHTITEKYTNTEARERQTSEVRSQYISQKVMADQYTDFYDAVGDSAQKKVWSDYVTALKNAAKDIKDQVDAANGYDQIKDLTFNWPDNPEGDI